MLRPALISAQRPDLFEVKQGTPPRAFCRRIAVWQSAGRILDLPARPSPIDGGWATSEGGGDETVELEAAPMQEGQEGE